MTRIRFPDPGSARPESGAVAEETARRHLAAAGLSLVDRNWHCRFGELDLVMRSADLLVFVEVRYRRSTRHGSPLASISAAKVERIRKTAARWLQAHPQYRGWNCRFDAVSITGDPGRDGQLNWIPSAF